MSQGRRMPPAKPAPVIREDAPQVGRPTRWIPDAQVILRAKDEATADAVCTILQDALGSHPDKIHVLIAVDPSELGEAERVEMGERAKLVPIRR